MKDRKEDDSELYIAVEADLSIVRITAREGPPAEIMLQFTYLKAKIGINSAFSLI